jgi:hypothetical protein
VRPREHTSFLQSVTDLLCGHSLQLCSPGELPAGAENEARLLCEVWELLDILTPPEPGAALMERMGRQALALAAASRELDDDELDRVVGAGKPPETGPDEPGKES